MSLDVAACTSLPERWKEPGLSAVRREPTVGKDTELLIEPERKGRARADGSVLDPSRDCVARIR